MKKNLLLFTAFVFASFIAKSQTKEWTFESYGATEYATTTDLGNGLTIMAGAETKVAIDGNKKTNGDYAFTFRLKLGGAGAATAEAPNMPTTRALVFDVTGPAKITVASLSSSSSTDRSLSLTDGSELIHSYAAPGSYSVDGNNIPLETYNYTGEAATLYLFSPSSGVNIYLVKVEPQGGTSIDANAADKGNIVSTEYYDITGRRLDASAKGLVIQKVAYENGSVETSKTIVR